MPTTLVLPRRQGPRPMTGPAIPHQQLSQNSPIHLQEELWLRMVGLEHVSTGPSGISLPDTRALHLDPRFAAGPPSAYAPVPGSTEFAHLHGPADGSLHASLSEDDAAAAIEAGWAELHPIARQGMAPPTTVMLYGPRDEAELETVWTLVVASYAFARGQADR